MPDERLTTLADLADRPPSPPPPVADLARRAQTRRRRRRAGGAVAVLAVLALAAGVVGLTGSDEEQETEVRTVDQETTTTTLGSSGLTVEPDTGLVDGQDVTLRFPEGGGPAEGVPAAQCASEAATAPDPLPWCQLSGSGGTFRVDRQIATDHGVIDCASAPGRCLIGVRPPTGGDRYAPISFRNDLPPIVPPDLEVAGLTDPIEDGALVSIEGTGFTPGDYARVSVCAPPTGPPGDETLSCDSERNLSSEVPVGEEGIFRAEFRIYRDIRTSADGGWRTCADECELRVGGERSSVRVPLRFEAAAPSIRPEVRIIAEGPYEPNQRVRLEGSGFQTGRIEEVGICPPDSTNGSECGFPYEGSDVFADYQGTFVIGDFPLPVAPGDWLLGTSTNEGSPLLYTTPFTVVG